MGKNRCPGGDQRSAENIPTVAGGDEKITSVLFIDSEDNIIYSEKVSGKTSYFKKFDLVNLKSGTYFFITKDDLRVIKYTVVVDGSDIVIRDKKERTKPFFRRKGAMLYLNLLNLDMGEVQIKVYDSDNRIVFKEILESQLVVEKAFNFKKAFQDNYTVAVTNGNATYYENILVK